MAPAVSGRFSSPASRAMPPTTARPAAPPWEHCSAPQPARPSVRRQGTQRSAQPPEPASVSSRAERPGPPRLRAPTGPYRAVTTRHTCSACMRTATRCLCVGRPPERATVSRPRARHALPRSCRLASRRRRPEHRHRRRLRAVARQRPRHHPRDRRRLLLPASRPSRFLAATNSHGASTWPPNPQRSSRPGEPGALLGSAWRRVTAPRPPAQHMECGHFRATADRADRSQRWRMSSRTLCVGSASARTGARVPVCR
jgi:hypothetical protein